MQEHLTAQSMNGNIQVEEVRLPIQHVASAIESLLFISGRPLEHAELRKLLNIDDARLASSLQVLADNLESQGRGIRLQRLGEHVQLVTAPENARYVAALLGLPMTAKLTTAAMETLAVVSYRQPATRAQIEAIRGVNSDRALASLIQHGLVAEIGRAQTVGRPALAATCPPIPKRSRPRRLPGRSAATRYKSSPVIHAAGNRRPMMPWTARHLQRLHATTTSIPSSSTLLT